MVEGISIKNETTVTVTLVIVIFAAAFSIGGVYMKVDDTAERQKAMEAKQDQMALDIAAIKQAVGISSISATLPDNSNPYQVAQSDEIVFSE